MLTNYVKLDWRVLLRRKFYTFVSLFGIAFTLIVLPANISETTSDLCSGNECEKKDVVTKVY